MNFALLLAAGKGSRFGGSKPKQFQNLAGKPVINYSLEKFENSEILEGYGVMIPAGFEKDMITGRSKKCLFVEPGGHSRRETVFLGLNKLKAKNPENVLIHDAARPLINEELIKKLFKEMNKNKEAAGIIPARPLRDTVKRVTEKEPEQVVETIARAELRRVQTPQLFKYIPLLKAHEQWDPDKNVTDDAMMLEEMGKQILTVEGPEDNLKITHPGDKRRLLAFLKGDYDEQ